MEKNNYGVYVNHKKIEFPIKVPKGWDNYREGITINYGDVNGKWGFSVEFQTDKYGQGCGISDEDLIYNSKNEMLDAIREEVVNISNKHFNSKLMFKGKHLDFILDEFYDKYKILCKFENEESWTIVETKSPDIIFNDIFRIYKKPAKYFEFEEGTKRFYNPSYKKESKFEQLELF